MYCVIRKKKSQKCGPAGRSTSTYWKAELLPIMLFTKEMYDTWAIKD
jgi:hypothetical protein